MVSQESGIKVFLPELISRRGEITAWALALLVLATSGALTVRLGRLSILPGLLGVLLGLAAVSISLGNWVDRQTRLEIAPEEVRFQNGLRRVRLPWSAIQRVQVSPSPLGDRIEVTGENAHFSFRTLGEVRVGGDLKGRMGFAEGEVILRMLIENSGLTAMEPQDGGQEYARR